MKTNPAVRFFLAGALVWAATALQAATYYVAPTGSDSHSGSTNSPFLTIQKGVDKAVAGDLVLKIHVGDGAQIERIIAFGSA